MSYRYNSFGRWSPSPVRRGTGSATDAAFLNSPAVLEAMAKIDRAFGQKPERPQ